MADGFAAAVEPDLRVGGLKTRRLHKFAGAEILAEICGEGQPIPRGAGSCRGIDAVDRKRRLHVSIIASRARSATPRVLHPQAASDVERSREAREAGDYVLRVEHDGFISQDVPIQIVPKSSVHQAVQLQRAP